MKQRIFTLAILALSLLTFACKRTVLTGIPILIVPSIETRIYRIDSSCKFSDERIIHVGFHEWNRRLALDHKAIRYIQSMDSERPTLLVTCFDSQSAREMDSTKRLTRERQRYSNRRLNAFFLKLIAPYNVIVWNPHTKFCLAVISHEINHDITGSNRHNHPYFLFPQYHSHGNGNCDLNAMTIGRNLVPIQP